jgi:hypothetical protein
MLRAPLFAQTVLDRNRLETRIVHLLEGKIIQTKELKKERRNVLFTLAFVQYVFRYKLSDDEKKANLNQVKVHAPAFAATARASSSSS